MKRTPTPPFPTAVTLRASAVIKEGDGTSTLYITAEDTSGTPRPYRVPTDATITVKAPRHLPTGGKRVFLPAGSSATFETPQGRSVLNIHSVRVCRELLEVLEAYSQARGAA